MAKAEGKTPKAAPQVGAKVLFLDIETSPLLGWTWSLGQQYVSPSQVLDWSSVLCWAAKWEHERRVLSASTWGKPYADMMREVHELLDEADVVVHFNGAAFDLRVLRREFALLGFLPPSPFKQLDLYLSIRRAMRFETTRLGHLVQRFELGQKKDAPMHVWLDAMRGREKARKALVAYNRHDVLLTERLYRRVRPWLPDHWNRSTLEGRPCCPYCGGSNSRSNGLRYGATGVYTRLQCLDCGGWFRGPASKRTKHNTPI